MSDPELAMSRGQNCTDGANRQIFRFNPGKSMRLYPERHPYLKTPNLANIQGILLLVKNLQMGGFVSTTLK